MTRDEAIETFHKVTYPDSGLSLIASDRRWSERAIDGFVALGMLKLDEPKSVASRAIDVLVSYSAIPYSIIDDLEKIGLHIVEK